MKNDPYTSIREALEKGVVIECRSPWFSNPYFADSSQPFYVWDNREFPSGLLKTQLEAADTWGLLEWEMVEENSTARLFELEKEAGSSFFLSIWRKQLRAIHAPTPDQTAPPAVRPKLGETRLVRAKAFRHKAMRENPHGVKQEVAWWESDLLPEPVLAVYTGFRTVYEGVILNSLASDTPGSFIVHQTLEVWKFVDNPRRKDYYVFPQDTMMGGFVDPSLSARLSDLHCSYPPDFLKAGAEFLSDSGKKNTFTLSVVNPLKGE